jgi:RES domain
MLEGVPVFQADHRVFRFANVIDFEDMLSAMGFNADDTDEILAFLGEARDEADATRLLDSPFAPKPQLEARKIARTRFSDGSLRVFYSSLEPETAELEIMYWYAGAALGSSRRVAYYRRLRCRFNGSAADLRGKVSDWPFLIADGEDAYARCQTVAREGLELNIAGFLTPSPRRASGTNVPVFRRQALSEPQILGVTALSRHASTGEVMVRRM